MSNEVPTTSPDKPIRNKRRRPARASRFVVGGLAASTGIAMVGVMARAAQEPAPLAAEQITQVVVVQAPTTLPDIGILDPAATVGQATAPAPEPPQPPPATTTTTTTVVVSQGS